MTEHDKVTAETPPPDPHQGDSAQSDQPPRSGSELEDGLDHLGRAVGGVLTRLLGSRYTQVELDPDRPVLSQDADQALDRAGATMGRWLRAAGDGLKTHPTDPVKALDHLAKHKDDDDLELREGEAPLAAGVRSLAGGLFRSTEAVLDVVAPRRPKPEDTAPEDTAPEDTAPEDTAPEDTAPEHDERAR